MKRSNNVQLNNKGLSLVELIIAISIGAIISGTIAALMTFAVRMYRNESANVSTQYELQTNVNQLVDTIKSANCFVIQQNDGTDPDLKSDTYYAAFGSFSGGNFTGVVFIAGAESPSASGKFNIYMDRGTWAGATAVAAVDAHVTAIEGDLDDDDASKEYLLGMGATQFRIEPVKEKTPVDASYPYVNISSEGYVNPLSIEVELSFEANAIGRKYNKHVKDEAMIRNRVSTPVYIDGDGFELIRGK